MLTDKAKTDFEKWLLGKVEYTNHEEFMMEWSNLANTFKKYWYFRWFDSTDMYVRVNRNVLIDDQGFFIMIKFDNMSWYKTLNISRDEANDLAIHKANELYNQKYS